MSTPRIGLTTYGEQASWGVWNEAAAVLHASYVDVVRQAGGAALLLPPGGDETEADTVLEVIDGLLLTGGADVDPARYGAQRESHTGPPRPDRDSYELALTRRALQLGMPVLGVCRGMQLLNVALGGTLVQHLPDLVGHDGHCATVGVVGRHPVRLQPGSRIAAMMGEQAEVSAYHHQGVQRLGADLTATGWAADGTVEAIEYGHGWVIGVQWHPEVDRLGSLVADFVAASAQAAGGRTPSQLTGGAQLRSGS